MADAMLGITRTRAKGAFVTSATTTIPCYPGLAYETALANMGGDTGLLHRLAQLFLEQHAADITLINSALAKQDWDLALHLTHALRGTAVNLGATTLYDSAQTLESTLCQRETAPACVPEAMAQAMTELVTTLRSLTT